MNECFPLQWVTGGKCYEVGNVTSLRSDKPSGANYQDKISTVQIRYTSSLCYMQEVERHWSLIYKWGKWRSSTPDIPVGQTQQLLVQSNLLQQTAAVAPAARGMNRLLWNLMTSKNLPSSSAASHEAQQATLITGILTASQNKVTSYCKNIFIF